MSSLTARTLVVSHLVLGIALLSSCTTTVSQGGVELNDEDERAVLAARDEEKKPSDLTVVEEQIKSAIDGLDFKHGSGLLQDLQFLVSMKELAVPLMLEKLEEAPARTRANILYVFGFTRTIETRNALVARLDEKDDVVRFEAAAGLLNQGNMASVPTLVAYLDHSEEHFRYKAIQALRLGTGKDFGFRFKAPQEMRTVAVDRWRTWWAGEKERLMIRPATVREG